jgi:hypothetical protein
VKCHYPKIVEQVHSIAKKDIQGSPNKSSRRFVKRKQFRKSEGIMRNSFYVGCTLMAGGTTRGGGGVSDNRC